MKPTRLILFLLMLLPLSVWAQSRQWTLDDCISHALRHNISIKSSELSARTKQVVLSDTKWAYAPDISLSSGYNLSTGRVLDPTTYDFLENQTVSGTSTSVGASITLFNGLRNLHALKRARLDLHASLLATQKTRNDVRLNVTACYLEILNAQENIRNAEQIVETLRLQAERTAKLVEARKVTSADLLQIESESARASNDLLSARNNYDIARLNICQLLDIEDYISFQTITPADTIARFEILPDRVLAVAQSLPELKGARVGVELARRDLSIARAAYYPSLTLSVGYGSSFSDARKKVFDNPDGTMHYEAYPFFEQYKDNASSYLSLSLNIPLFGKLTTRRNVRTQQIALHQAEYTLQMIEKQVCKEITQAQIDAHTAWEKYLSSQKFVASATEAVRQMEHRYNLGAVTAVDYHTTLNTLVQAQTQFLQAKYEYLFKTEILRFYLAQ